MSWTYSVNNTPATAGAAALLLINAMITAGWSLPQWSDGTTVTSVGVPTAANLNTSYAWVRLQAPADFTTGVVREICMQFSGTSNGGTTSSNWAIKYSARARFTSASPTPGANMPTATDEVGFGNQCTCPSPVYGNSSSTSGCLGNSATIFMSTAASQRFHIAVGNSGTADAGSFWCVTSVNTTTTLQSAFALDVPIPWAGTSDLDSAVCYFVYIPTCYLLSSLATLSCGHAGQILSQSSTLPLSYNFCALEAPQSRNLPVNSWSGNVPLLTPMWFAVYQASTLRGVGCKGQSRVFITDLGSAGRTNYDLFTVGAAGDHVWLNGTLLPWPTGTAVTL